ncbi:heme uptake protein IsdC [Bacillus sp. FJAT-49711]|uniref:heme uptake protein IsdC n=1 Tax=Bacillus sp. FJAT-49711 TaxID=2833585 RepID=UPI001BC9A620|nr:heme uptake protein IsdC [Bacillus sp. FJAT-49711]MBS4218503.1 heme uptake protein IsdC [Bacillus sp. FJAT-49711]
MKKMIQTSFMITLICLLTFVFIPQGSASAKIEDGTYSVDYVVLKAENNSVSMANDYFSKPATLTVENGVQHIQITLKSSEWIKELKAPKGGSFADVTVVSENKTADTRVVKFKVDGDLSKPLEMKMHVYIDSMKPVYDHNYTVRVDFKVDSMKKTGGTSETNDKSNGKQDETENKTQSGNGNKEGNKQVENNPKTGDQSSFVLLFIALFASGFFIIRKVNLSKQTN